MNSQLFLIFLLSTLAFFATSAEAQDCNTTGTFTNPIPLSDGAVMQAVACVNQTAYFVYTVVESISATEILFVDIISDLVPYISYYANGSTVSQDFDQYSQTTNGIQENIINGLIFSYNVINGNYIISVANTGQATISFVIDVYLSGEIKQFNYTNTQITSPVVPTGQWLYYEFIVDTLATAPYSMLMLQVTPFNASEQSTFITNYVRGDIFPTLEYNNAFSQFTINNFTSYYIINSTSFLAPPIGGGAEVTYHLGIRNSGPSTYFTITAYTLAELQLTSSVTTVSNLAPSTYQFFSIDVAPNNRNSWIFLSIISNGVADASANLNYAFNDYSLFMNSQWSKTTNFQVLSDGTFLHEYIILPALYPSIQFMTKITLLNNGNTFLNATVSSYFVTPAELNLDQINITVIPYQWSYFFFTINLVGRLFVLDAQTIDNSEYIFPTMRYGDIPIAGEATNNWSQISNSTKADSKKTVTTYIYPSVQLPLPYFVRLRSTDTSVTNKTISLRTYVSDEEFIQPYHNRFFGEFIAGSDMNFYTFVDGAASEQMVIEVISFSGNITIFFQDNGYFPTLSDYQPWTNIDYFYDNTLNYSHQFVFLSNPFVPSRQLIRLAAVNNNPLNTRYNLYVHFFSSIFQNLGLNMIIKKTISTGDWHYYILNLAQDSPALYIRLDEEFGDDVDVFIRKDTPPTSLGGTFIISAENITENNQITGGEREYFIYKSIPAGTYYIGLFNTAVYTARYTLALSQNATFPDTPTSQSSSISVPNPPSPNYSGIIIGVSSGCGVAIVMGLAWFIINKRKVARADGYHLVEKI